MSEREKDALNTIVKAYPHMSEFDKGYILGAAECRAREKERENCCLDCPGESRTTT